MLECRFYLFEENIYGPCEISKLKYIPDESSTACSAVVIVLVVDTAEMRGPAGLSHACFLQARGLPCVRGSI